MKPWPPFFPPRSALSPHGVAQFEALHAGLLADWTPAADLDPAALGLARPERWHRKSVPMQGRVASGRPVILTAWTWDVLDGEWPGLGFTLGPNGHGRFYPRPSHPEIGRQLKAEGRKPNGVTGANLLVGALDLAPPGRERVRVITLNGDPCDLRLFNIGFDFDPLQPGSDDPAKAARLGPRIGRKGGR
jgi:hypothetical protein